MNGFSAFRYYLAVKLHFNNDKFNVFENNGHVKYSMETFNARNDRFIFDKLARKFNTAKDIIQFYVANFAYGNDNFIYGIEEAEQCYNEWVRRKESLTKVFHDDLSKVQLEIEKNAYTAEQIFSNNNGNFPVILKLYLGKIITIETMSILNARKPIIHEWKQDPNITLVFEQDLRRIEKLLGFIKYDAAKIEKIYFDLIANFDVGLYK